MKIEINLSEAETKAMYHIARSPQEWTEHAVKERARLAIEKIFADEVQRLISLGQNVTGSKEDIVLAAPIKTAVEIEKEIIEEEARLSGQEGKP